MLNLGLGGDMKRIKVDTTHFKMMGVKGEEALYWRWLFSINGCTVKQYIVHQVWF